VELAMYDVRAVLSKVLLSIEISLMYIHIF